MSVFKNLKFFDKGGNRQNFSFNEEEDYFEGSIYFSEVSTSLIENEHIFIIEEYQKGNSTEYGYPTALNYASPVDPKWRARWESTEDEDEIYLYTIGEEFVPEDGKAFPFIQKATQVEIVVDDLPYTMHSVTERKVLTSLDLINSSSVSINIAMTAETEDIFDRDLIIEDISDPDTPVVIAKIAFHGETVGEDERFRLMLENFGRKFNEEDAFILRGYDIKEEKPDWKDINRKRKELLLTGEEIYPFIGGYKGLINAIKFFEYQDLRVKEYWLNINPDSENYNKYQLYELTGLIDNPDREVKLTNPLIPNPNYKKTSLFSLVYDITVETGGLDEFGIPITENAFTFTPEEVVIKLFALKKRLKRDFLPLNARIVDITGEGIYFERYGINVWQDLLQTERINIGDWLDFECSPEFGHMQDLRFFNVKRYEEGMDFPQDRYTNTIEPYQFAQKYPPESIEGLLASINSFYDDLKNDLIENFGDEEGFESLAGRDYEVPTGMPVIFENTSFDITWDELDSSWNSLVNTPLQLKVQMKNETSPATASVTAGIKDQITGNEVTVTVGGSPTGAEIAAALSSAVSSSILEPFTDFNIIYVTGEDFFTMRDTTGSDVLFGFIPTDESFGERIVISNDDFNLSWDFLGLGQFYEIEWIIEKPGPNPFYFKLRGSIRDYVDLPFFLPYTGRYTVTMSLIDAFNHASVQHKKECVEVFPKELEINTFARFQNREKYTWDDMVDTWDDYAGSMWDRIREATDFGDAPIPEYLLNFKKYEYQDIEVLDEDEAWQPYDGFNLTSNIPDVAKSWGTKSIFTWEKMDDITWEDMFHTTWEMMDYHAGFLGGFEIFDPQPGDTMTVGPYAAFTFGPGSPPSSPYTLQDAIDDLNDSTLSGISDFIYSLQDSEVSTSTIAPSPLTTQFIHAEAKFVGATGYYFIEYTGNVTGDPYSFRFPNWLDGPILQGLNEFLDANPGVNPDYLFTDAIESDIISGAAGSNSYWFNSPHNDESPPDPGINGGQVMSWAGNGALTSSDIRGFKNDSVIPKGVPVFFVTEQSKVFGKKDFRWILYKQGDDGRTQEKIIELRGQPFFIWRFEEAGDYSLELFANDTFNNEYNVKRNGLIRIIEKEEWDESINKVPVNSFEDFTQEVINFQ